MPGGWSDMWGEARMANGDLREGMVSKDDDGGGEVWCRQPKHSGGD